MTPLELEIILHYYSRATDYRDGDFTAPAVRDSIEWMKGEGKILEPRLATSRDTPIYKLTDRGRVFVDKICSISLPVQRWVYESANPPKPQA